MKKMVDYVRFTTLGSPTGYWFFTYAGHYQVRAAHRFKGRRRKTNLLVAGQR